MSSGGSDYGSGSEGYSGGERGFKVKKHKKDKKDKDKKEKDHKDKDKDKKEKKDKDKKDGGKDKDKDKKDKKDKDKHHEEPAHPHGGSSSGHATFSGPGYAPPAIAAAQHFFSSTPSSGGEFRAPAPGVAHGASPAPPPPYAQSPGFPQGGGIDTKQVPYPGAPPPVANPPPPSGYRVPLRTDAPFPTPDQAGPPVTYDLDGISYIFIGSALFETSVQPCKVGPHLQPYVSVAYAGGEYAHNGRYDLLPFVPEQMEWVRTADGQIPPGRRAIEGGYEENGAKLYHALAYMNGIKVPGKTGEHLAGANVAFGGAEHRVREYEILCWKL